MNLEPILYETHMHTPLCKHASGQPEEYAAVAEQRGLKGIIVTCHNPTTNGWSPETRMRLDQFDDYLAMVERARQAWVGRVDVRVGLECDYLPDMEPWLTEILSRAEFNYVLGSVHAPLKEYQARYFKGDIVAFQQTYFEHLAQSAESGLFDTLAHPDLVKIVHPKAWQPELVLDDIRRCLDRIADTGVAMELNTSGLNKPLPEMNPGRLMLEEMFRRHIPVVLGADAHKPERVADKYEEALELLHQVGYSHVSIFLGRERQDIKIEAARRSLQASKMALPV